MAIYKTKRHIMDDEGAYHVVYEETTTDQVKHPNGTTVEDHIDSITASTDGAHGLRYNQENTTLEWFNPTTECWEEIGIINEIVRLIMNGLSGDLSVELFVQSGEGLFTSEDEQILANKKL